LRIGPGFEPAVVVPNLDSVIDVRDRLLRSDGRTRRDDRGKDENGG
jgi:hypothetical protein